MSTFRILSIDGGGLKGAFPASFLATIERQLPAPIATYFDLITGTSTGGIIALALALHIPAEQVVAFYKEHGSRIFPVQRRGWLGRLARWLRPQYDGAPLQEALSGVFQDRLISKITPV